MLFRSLLDTRNYPALRATKLHSPLVGPFKVLERPSASTAKLALPAGMHIHPVVNLDAVRPYHADKDAAPPPGPVRSTKQGEALWAVDRILDSRIRHKKKQFKIRGQGFGPEHDSWEPATEFEQFPLLVQAFEATLPKPRTGK